MNWNNDTYVIEPYVLLPKSVALEQCNWPGGLPEYEKPSISFYNIFPGEDIESIYTVAVWRKKEVHHDN